MAEGNVVTFYSYKGGVGRSMALANVGALLCQWGYRVLCVDWDLEAPGLHLYFEKRVQKWKPGITDMILDHVAAKAKPWSRYVTNVDIPKAAHPLGLMTAGKQDSKYVSRLQSLDWPDLYAKHGLGAFLEAMRSHWKSTYDFVLVDSRTGITDIGGICTVQLPDQLVLLFTANQQGLLGSLDVIKRARVARQHLPYDRGGLQVLPVATRFEIRVEYKMSEEWLDRFARELADLYSGWADKDVTPRELLNHTRLPYIPYWSFGEKLAVLEKGTKDPEDLGFPIETLAALIAHRLGSSEELVKRRDFFVGSVRHFNGLNGSARGSDTPQASPDTWETAMPDVPASDVAKEVRQVLASVPVPQRTPSWALAFVRAFAGGVVEGFDAGSEATLRMLGINLKVYLGRFMRHVGDHKTREWPLVGLLWRAARAVDVPTLHLLRIGSLIEEPRADMRWATWLIEFLNVLPGLIELVYAIESRTGIKFKPH